MIIFIDDESNSQGLFTLKTFKQHVTPHLIKMFKVRDIVVSRLSNKDFFHFALLILIDFQVRLLLLKHFYGYMTTFDEHDLTNYILPDVCIKIEKF